MNPPSAAPSLDGQCVALTGRLVSLTRAEAAVLVRAHGGRLVRDVTSCTSLLVVGQDGWPLRTDGRLSRKLQRAQALAEGGAAVRILSEEEFLEGLDLQDRRPRICRRYTLLQLTRILRVPRGRLRMWVRAELIRPVETVHRVAYFDYAAVSRIRRLRELVEAGVSPSRLKRSLDRLQQWLPGANDALRQLDRLAGDRRLVFRLPDGRLAEPHGQLLFDFEASAQAPASLGFPGAATPSAEALFEHALAHEDAGRFAEAAAAYQRWRDHFGPDAGVSFNLGNSLSAVEDWDGAAAAFREAVRLDPQFVEAWSNLGRVLDQQGAVPAAIGAFGRALRLDPGYADAHYNLADLLDRTGRTDQAREHWRTYLESDDVSEWADYARRRLAAGAIHRL